MDTSATEGGAGFFLLKKAGGMFVKDSGNSGTFFALLSTTLDGARTSPLLSELGCWNIDMLVPWKDVLAVVY